MEPTRPRRSKGKSGSGRRAKARDEDYEDDDDLEDDEDEEEEFEDDDDWDDDDDRGVLTGLLDWVEANSKAVGAVLLLVLLGLGWLAFGRESFAQDAEDLEVLIDIKSKISTANTMGVNPADWEKLNQSTSATLQPMIDRLKETASAKDHIKQELLFASRDDIPKMFNELPKGIKSAEQRINTRFGRIETMIKNEERVNAGSVLTLAPQSPPQQNVPDNSGQAEINEGVDNNQQPENPQGQQNQNQNVPQNNPGGGSQGNPPNQVNNFPAGSSQQNMNPQSGGGQQPMNQPPPPQNSQPISPGPGGIPGQPKPAKF